MAIIYADETLANCFLICYLIGVEEFNNKIEFKTPRSLSIDLENRLINCQVDELSCTLLRQEIKVDNDILTNLEKFA